MASHAWYAPCLRHIGILTMVVALSQDQSERHDKFFEPSFRGAQLRAMGVESCRNQASQNQVNDISEGFARVARVFHDEEAFLSALRIYQAVTSMDRGDIRPKVNGFDNRVIENSYDTDDYMRRVAVRAVAKVDSGKKGFIKLEDLSYNYEDLASLDLDGDGIITYNEALEAGNIAQQVAEVVGYDYKNEWRRDNAFGMWNLHENFLIEADEWYLTHEYHSKDELDMSALISLRFNVKTARMRAAQPEQMMPLASFNNDTDYIDRVSSWAEANPKGELLKIGDIEALYKKKSTCAMLKMFNIVDIKYKDWEKTRMILQTELTIFSLPPYPENSNAGLSLEYIMLNPTNRESRIQKENIDIRDEVDFCIHESHILVKSRYYSKKYNVISSVSIYCCL